jgi:hypothetical protein
VLEYFIGIFLLDVHQFWKTRGAMRVVNYGFLAGAILLFFVGLYYWLAKGQIDGAAFFFALAAVGQGVYLMATKAEKAG